MAGSCGVDRRGELPRAALSGPDPIVVRVAQKGGKVRAYRYPDLDSALWSSARAMPAVGQLLGFDHENGVLAYVDTTGIPGWIDLRMGTVTPATKRRHASIATADGWSIYGVSSKNEIARFTPAGDWTLADPKRAIRQLIPQRDGTLLVVQQASDGETIVMRMRPPASGWLDSLELEDPQEVARTEIGDRVYFAVGRRLVSVNAANLEPVSTARLPDEIMAVAPTPSGDRVYVASRGSSVLEVLDRYREAVMARVRLPGVVAGLRMDPLGRYLLVRAKAGDSMWVVSTANHRNVGSIQGTWRDDLPALAADGAVAVARGEDVMLVDPERLEVRGHIAGGAADRWFFMLWNGFRPRAHGIDEPVRFEWWGRDSSLAAALGDSGAIAIVGRGGEAVRPDVPTAPSAIEPARPPAPPTRRAWIVSFAVLLTHERAQALAHQIHVDGDRARVVAGQSGDTPVFRVVMGPYPTREDAERAGKSAGRSYWVYDGAH
ncbi:MAG: SPOR domain-containing protein [Gemmatimonadaceae bacterium]